MAPTDLILSRFCDLFNALAAFATAIKSAARAVIKPTSPVVQRRTSVPSYFLDTEAAALAVFTADSNKKPVDWRQFAPVFCLSSGVALCIVPDPVKRESPISFQVLPVLIAVTIASVFVSNSIVSRHPAAARVLEFIWKLCMAAALFTALCIPLGTVILKCVVWAIFGGALAVVLAMSFISSSSSSA